MTERPYLQASLPELTARFEVIQEDAGALRVLAAELRHRTTQGAQRLLNRVENRIQELGRRSDAADAAAPAPTTVVAAEDSAPMTLTEEGRRLRELLERTRMSLLDLSRRNRLLNFKEATRDIALSGVDPDRLLSALDDGGTFKFDPSEDPDEDFFEGGGGSRRRQSTHLPTPYAEKELLRRLEKLQREYRTQLEETGGNSLFLAIGLLVFRDSPDSEVLQKAPLLLIPVRMNKERGRAIDSFSIGRHDDELDTNYSLLHKLSELGFRLPLIEDASAEEEAEGTRVVPSRYLDLVREAVDAQRDEHWEVEDDVVLGLFRFQKQVMWHDLDPDRWPAHAPITDSEMLQRVLLGPGPDEKAPGILRDLIDQEAEGAPDLKLILDADSSQYSALADALNRAGGLVIEGPPGTGKSQTISNLIAAAIHQGKTVLFVAEKMAALEVVYQRLNSAGLGDLCLQLHGLATNKAALAEDLKQRKALEMPKQASIAEEQRKWRRTREQLKELSRLLQTPIGPLALPAHAVVWRLEKARQALPDAFEPDALPIACDLTREEFESAYDGLMDLGRGWDALPVEARDVWAGFVPKGVTEVKQRRIEEVLEGTAVELDACGTSWASVGPGQVVAEPPNLDYFERLKAAIELGLLPPDPAVADFAVIRAVLDEGSVAPAQSLLDRLEKFLAAANACTACFDYESATASDLAAQLQEHLAPIVGVTDQPGMPIAELGRRGSEIDLLVAALRALPDRTVPARALLNAQPSTLREFEALGELAAALIDGPDELVLYGHERYARSAAPSWLKIARERAEALEAEFAGLQEFVPERVNDVAALAQDAATLRRFKGKWFPALRKAYRRARDRVQAVCAAEVRVSRDPGFLDLVDRLSALCEQREALRVDVELVEFLGPPFKGIETDWVLVSALVETGARLRKDIGAEAAAAALNEWSDHRERIQLGREAIEQALALLEQFRATSGFPTNTWSRPVREIGDLLEPHARRLHEAAEALATDSIYSSAGVVDALKASRDEFPRACRLEDSLRADEHFDRLLSAAWQGPSTDPRRLRASIAWILDALEPEWASLPLLGWLVPDDQGPSERRLELLTEQCARIGTALGELVAVLEDAGELDRASWIAADRRTIADFTDHLRACARHAPQLIALQQWHRLASDLASAGLEALVDALRTGELDGSQVPVAFDACVHRSAFEKLSDAHEALRGFTHAGYENLRSRFAEVDKRLLELAGQEVKRVALRSEPPAGVSGGLVGDLTEMALINHQIGLKKRHRPIRYLVDRAGTALQALKPCFLMSPMSVAQFLPRGGLKFDLLVMDEASQIRPEDALGAIARARTCIVVGDPKQLPPTSFFDSPGETHVDEDDEAVTENVESILDTCLRQIPYRRLTWHYRSEHEALIQFSNERFYEGDLHVFPSPRRDVRELGVHATLVEKPSYRRGGHNKGEAVVVVQCIVQTLFQFPGATIGAVAMNKRQAEEILSTFERVRRERPELEDLIAELAEPVFVKNLENVQGDERDVIVMSTTYGPEAPGGPVAQRFGPLNSETGWRRLNVIATRARQRVEVVTSLRPTDVLVGPQTRRGVREFRNYLEYAFSGRVPDLGGGTGNPPDSDFERSVLAQLERMDIQGEPQIGVAGFFIDIGIKHPEREGEFLLGIECDGATYHSAKSVRDRDRLRQEILEGKGWRIHRIWSTSWFHARGAEIERLRNAIDEALAADRKRAGLPGREASKAGSASLPERAYDSEELALVDDVDVAARPETVPDHVIAQAIASVEEQATEETEEEADSATSLAAELERYWRANIREQFPERERSILSPEMIRCFVAKRPFSREEFVVLFPVELRTGVLAAEMEFLPDILAIIEEWG